MIRPKLEAFFLIFLAMVLIVQLLDVGNKPRINVSPTSPFIDLHAISTLEAEIHFLLNRNWFSSLHPFIPREEITSLLSEKSYIAASSIEVNVGISRLDISVVPEQPLAVIATDDGYEFILTTAGYLLEDFDADHTVAGVAKLVAPGVFADAHSNNNKVLPETTLRAILDVSCFFGITNPYVADKTNCNLQPAFGLKLDRVELTSNPRQLDIIVTNPEADQLRIIMSTDGDIFEQGTALIKTLEFLHREDKPLPEQYIDVRLIDRTIYL